jgi:hypothetical protein
VPASAVPPWLRWLRGVPFVVLVLAAAGLHLATASASIRRDETLQVVLSVLVVSIVLAVALGRMTETSDRRVTMLVAAVAVTAVFSQLSGPVGVGAAVLAERGKQVDAVVKAARIEKSRLGDNVHYTLTGPDSKRIPGEWTTALPAPHAVGEPVTVVVDPDGLVHPHAPDDVASAWTFWLVGAVILLPALLLALAAGSPIERPARRRPVRR